MDDRELAVKALRVLGFEQVESWGEKGVQFVELDAATERISCWAFPIPTSWALAGLVLERLAETGHDPDLRYSAGEWTLSLDEVPTAESDPSGPRAVLLGAVAMAACGEEGGEDGAE